MSASSRSGLRAFGHALRAALQWRLLLLWILAMLIPTAIVALPLWASLRHLLDHSVHSTQWATHFDALAMSDVYIHARGLSGVAVVSLIATLLLSPLLTGMAVTAARASRKSEFGEPTFGEPAFGELLRGAAHAYWPLLRLLLLALLPFGAAAAIGAVGLVFVTGLATHSVLQTQADNNRQIVVIVLAVLLALAHAVVESGRAQFAVDPSLRSAWRALWRGAGVVLRRPFATFGMYVGVSCVGYALALGLAILRVRTTAVGWSGFILALALTQLITAALAWQRTARLFALMDVARTRS